MKEDYSVCKLEKIFTVKETEEIAVDGAFLMFLFLNGLSGLSFGIIWALPRVSQLLIPLFAIILLLMVFWVFCFDCEGLRIVKVKRLVQRKDVKL